MNKLMTGALALGLAASLTACSSSTEPASNTSAPPSSASPAAPSASGVTESSDAPTSSAPETTSQEPAAAGSIDQSTPEGVMTAWLNALVDGKTADICTLTAVGGKLVSDVSGGQEQCTKSLGTLAGSLKSAGSLFDGLTIKGATITGDKATFDKATTKPELAAQVIKSLAAVKIGSKWYVTTP
ncbi:hypothetical protein BA895_12880 [Humibacillus sp. DSM 29435]|uniref:hypothetical protein n=1 Tax=Humibacillus sp. DSM 29435 TaxID=1869167 RepID=UPI000871F976|nr:hypothetical protein [Humibacillus sp. DSM 29435]OFE18033.1 hypothetical protein BA895_12880 [Humibacillus sp. DSM 29435]